MHFSLGDSRMSLVAATINCSIIDVVKYVVMLYDVVRICCMMLYNMFYDVVQYVVYIYIFICISYNK